jgi:hypothetical protein
MLSLGGRHATLVPVSQECPMTDEGNGVRVWSSVSGRWNAPIGCSWNEAG